MRHNEFGQPIGDAVPGFTPGERPGRPVLQGRFCRLERLSAAQHGDDLYAFHGPGANLADWTYVPREPVPDRQTLQAQLERLEASEDPCTFVIIEAASNQVVGSFSLMRIDPANRVIEVGSITYSDRLKRTRMATEAQLLLAQYVFETLKYRRYEWKCDSLNQPSRNAALRLGFTYEGMFRQAIVYKGRNRDTCWYSMLDSEWPRVKRRLEKWLSDDNFDPGAGSAWRCKTSRGNDLAQPALGRGRWHTDRVRLADVGRMGGAVHHGCTRDPCCSAGGCRARSFGRRVGRHRTGPSCGNAGRARSARCSTWPWIT